MPSNPQTVGGFRFQARPQGLFRRLMIGAPFYFQTWNTSWQVEFTRVGPADEAHPIEALWDLDLALPSGERVSRGFRTRGLEMKKQGLVSFKGLLYKEPGHYTFQLTRKGSPTNETVAFYSFEVGRDRSLWLLPWALATVALATYAAFGRPDFKPNIQLEAPVNNIQVVIPTPAITPAPP